MSSTTDIYKAAAIILRERKVLVERSFGKTFFVHPGGKLEPGETYEQALIRELQEEFQINVNEADLELFAESSAEAANNPGQTVHMKVYIVKKWQGEITPASEVEAMAWIGSQVPADMPVGSIMRHDTLPKLKVANLID